MRDKTKTLGEQGIMISVVIPTLNAGPALLDTLTALLPANDRGVIREVIISDGGSSDRTLAIADDAGAVIVEGPRGRGQQLRAGADIARGPWLLFLHADTILETGWDEAAFKFMTIPGQCRAATFRLKFAESGLRPWLVALGANLRTRWRGLPYGDQGLLISRQHYDAVGGYAPLPLFEDVDLIDRLQAAWPGGDGCLSILSPRAITSAERYQRDGYISRVLKNNRCIRLYRKGVPPADILEVYYGRSSTPTSGRHGKAAAGGPGQDTPQS
ncbi:TIGR04283 family arsenosugar biosynthesis glycosyltransferase [Parvularcula sp. LCG005]|uniref:TIGR04283 family arsenosugar biosynthesis glycosyltransferase n=1 Tax=Parvularcula sp. LCG005 TaxID=3078805 RepID=UPI002943F7A9|nr:TIGR04283 family arsenosugar biosynthesis glycosyltransferase [Parvularcula sp. LCG005]WOI53757.1 TIGR04283 family arsenosugar biosynthesis glycosyltransferase [Parvularcula sp. LCG005]